MSCLRTTQEAPSHGEEEARRLLATVKSLPQAAARGKTEPTEGPTDEPESARVKTEGSIHIMHGMTYMLCNAL